jgi:hypothetical protein
MSVIKQKKDYTLIPFSLIEDNKMSLAARALVMYIMSFEGERDLQLEDLYQNFDNQKNKQEIDELVKEAVNNGYIYFEEKQINKPSFYGFIPANVRYCKEIENEAKVLYAEITALCQENGYCCASNNYFSELYEVGTLAIQSWIVSLQKQGFIEVCNGLNRKIYLKGELA